MDWSSLVGLPWKDKGRGPDGWDCWGLKLLAHERLRGVVLPSFLDRYPNSTARAAIAGAISDELPGWIRIAPGAEQPFDGVLMKIEGGWHIGVVVRPGMMLHMPRGGTSVIEPYRTARFAHAVARGGFYRHGGPT